MFHLKSICFQKEFIFCENLRVIFVNISSIVTKVTEVHEIKQNLDKVNVSDNLHIVHYIAKYSI